MLHDLVPIVAIICAIGLPIGLSMFIAFASIKAKHKEKMEAIKLGVPLPEEQSKTPSRLASLRIGMICIGVALGIILGGFLSGFYRLYNEDRFFLIAAMVVLFVGLAYTIYFFISKKMIEEGKEQK